MVKDRTGLETVATNGQKMKIYMYHNANNIDVQFEDGTIVKRRSMVAFNRGEIKNPNKPYVPKHHRNYFKEMNKIVQDEKKDYYEGLRLEQYSGWAICIVYRDNSDIDVQFEDDGEIVNTNTYRFREGKVRKGKDRKLQGSEYMDAVMSKTFVNREGRSYKIIGGENSRSFDIKFDDGVVRRNMKGTPVLKGMVVHPKDRTLSRMKYDAEKRIGEVYYSGIGMRFVITGYTIKDNKVYYKVRFDDDTEIEVYDGGQFKKGELAHPRYSGKCKEINIFFHGFNVYRKEFSEGKGGNKYYSCACSKCKLESILTFDEMIKHECVCLI